MEPQTQISKAFQAVQRTRPFELDKGKCAQKPFKRKKKWKKPQEEVK